MNLMYLYLLFTIIFIMFMILFLIIAVTEKSLIAAFLVLVYGALGAFYGYSFYEEYTHLYDEPKYDLEPVALKCDLKHRSGTGRISVTSSKDKTTSSDFVRILDGELGFDQYEFLSSNYIVIQTARDDTCSIMKYYNDNNISTCDSITYKEVKYVTFNSDLLELRIMGSDKYTLVKLDGKFEDVNIKNGKVYGFNSGKTVESEAKNVKSDQVESKPSSDVIEMKEAQMVTQSA